MVNVDPNAQAELQLRALQLRWYQARLGFWQAVIGIIFVSGVAVAIPAAVDSYKVYQERKLKEQEIALKDKELEEKILDSHQQYISNFLTTALNQDIELRIRFAEYFSSVSDIKYREGWQHFRDGLEKHRDMLRTAIDEEEKEVDKLRVRRSSLSVEDQSHLAQLERELSWHYAELGYVRRDSNVTAPVPPFGADYGKGFNGNLTSVSVDSLSKVFGAPSTSSKEDACNKIDGPNLTRYLTEVKADSGDQIRVIKPAAQSLQRILQQIQNDSELAHTVSISADDCAFYSSNTKSFLANAWGVSVAFGGQYASLVNEVFASFFPTGNLPYSPDALLKLERIAKFFRDERWYWGAGDRIKKPNYFIISQALFDDWVAKGEFKTGSVK